MTFYQKSKMLRAYFSSSVPTFLSTDNYEILGHLARNHTFALEDKQKDAWLNQIDILKNALSSFSDGYLFFEFAIPRMGKRVDNILIINDMIFVLEFKVHATTYDTYALEQVIDYAMDLKNFHEASHDAKIFPILVATNGPEINNTHNILQDKVYSPLFANAQNLSHILLNALQTKPDKAIDPKSWAQSTYKPTPTIVQAAQALYHGHNVEEISRSDAKAINLSKTTETINHIIEKAKRGRKKAICFVTGVPGAGKTLAGLNIATQRMHIDKNEHAVFLSGNGPLVDVLREALTRDDVARAKAANQHLTKKEAQIKTHAFIQNIHHFRDDALITQEPPIEKVVVFDEAQRAWDKKQTSAFMRTKRGQASFDQSEPNFLMNVMDRHTDWCTIICLIGGGQEINTGEAGMEEWVSIIREHFPDWVVHYSPHIVHDDHYLTNSDSKQWLRANAFAEKNLHLSVSLRSFRSEKLSEFIHALLSLEKNKAKAIYQDLKITYPICLTRNIHTAKRWLTQQRIGSERSGIVASSGGYRLRPFGIDVRNQINAPIWFLNGKDDVRSSFFHEEIATEFDIQGLELDWVCVAWDGDMYLENDQWVYRKFKGTKWQMIRQDSAKTFLLNAYRVLLTRARQGIILFIPEGSTKDHTRLPEYFDETYQYLLSLGIDEV